METTVKIFKDNGLLVQIVELSFDEYQLVYDSLKLNSKRFEYFKEVTNDDEKLKSMYENDYQAYINLLKKFEL